MKERGRVIVRTRGAPAAALLALVFTAGCGTTLSDLSLPGGGVDGPTYRITATFTDVLTLPDGARVRVDGVDVGRVSEISTRDFLAQVQLEISERVTVTDDARLELRTTTPLGEGFLDLDPGGGTPLADGGQLPRSATRTVAKVEDTLAAAALLLSGGGLGQLKTIVGELNRALDGRTGDVRSLLRSLTEVLGAFNDRTDDIDAALDALDSLSGTLANRRPTLRAALRDVAPAAALLADSTEDIARLLAKLADLGQVADRVVRRTRADLIATLREIEPVLDALISIETKVGPTLSQLVRFGKFLDASTPGDYLTGDADLSRFSLAGEPAAAQMTLRQMMSKARSGAEAP
ncbi:MAG: MCE family protein [Sporichthyaceae bacterium]